MDAAASWQRVESSMGLIAAIISQLEPEDLVRASAVSRLWRDAATDEQLWQHMCTAIPLLAQLKAEAWCELSWRELFAQQRRCDDIAKRAQDERVPIGPRHELEHYRAFVGDGKLPAGCTQVTCAMIERNGLLERLDTEYEQSRLDKGRALFSELPLTPRPVAELASDLGRIKTQKYPLAPANSYLAKLEYYSEGDSSWLEAHIAKHEQNAVDFGEIDARGVRTFFGAVLQLKPSQIRKLVGEMIDKRDGYWTSSSARKAYRVTIKFCNDVLARMTATADAPSTDERDCVQQNNIRKACKCTRRHCNDTPFLRSLAVGSRNGSGGLGTFGVDGSGTPGRAYPSLSSVLARPVTCVCDVHV